MQKLTETYITSGSGTLGKLGINKMTILNLSTFYSASA